MVAVARDLDLGSPDTRLPAEPQDLARVAELRHAVGHREARCSALTDVLCSADDETSPSAQGQRAGQGSAQHLLDHELRR